MRNVKMQGQNLKGIQTKLVRGLLDTVILQLLRTNPMHGYQIIISLRKNFGVYFGPSTIYPLLCLLEERGLITSQWNLENERPRKVYRITPQGSDLLNSAEASLGQIYRKLTNGFERIPANNKGETFTSSLEPRKPLGFTY
jgi:DNA-binding PadR family transcriptional regulator